jgi:2-dehydro-3-deoxygluconokinase
MAAEEVMRLALSPKICCAGEVMIEFAEHPSGSFYQRGIAGDSFNTAVYLARAGLSVEYLTCLGDDLLSDGIMARLQEERIKSGHIRRLENRQPGLYLISNDEAGERQFSYWRGQSPARELFDQAVELPGVTDFYFTGVTLGVCRSGFENLVGLLHQLRHRGCGVIFDPNYRLNLWENQRQAQEYCRQVLPLCTTVLATLDDDARLWGIEEVDACREFYLGFGLQELVIKASDLTAHAFSGGEQVVKSARRVSALDTTGAGDSFNAGYLAARFQGKSMDEAISNAQALAARVVQYRGAIIPKKER